MSGLLLHRHLAADIFSATARSHLGANARLQDLLRRRSRRSSCCCSCYCCSCACCSRFSSSSFSSPSSSPLAERKLIKSSSRIQPPERRASPASVGNRLNLLCHHRPTEFICITSSSSSRSWNGFSDPHGARHQHQLDIV